MRSSLSGGIALYPTYLGQSEHSLSLQISPSDIEKRNRRKMFCSLNDVTYKPALFKVVFRRLPFVIWDLIFSHVRMVFNRKTLDLWPSAFDAILGEIQRKKKKKKKIQFFECFSTDSSHGCIYSRMFYLPGYCLTWAVGCKHTFLQQWSLKKVVKKSHHAFRPIIVAVK